MIKNEECTKNNIEHEKLEIINWIFSINDEKLLKKVSSLKEKSTSDLSLSKSNSKGNVSKKIRQFGFGKGTFTYTSEDFDTPLEEFKNYML